MLVTVRDTGVGMTPEEISVALTPFGQVDASHARWREGTGLGLPIARALVQLHGGELSIRSEKGKGTAVEVRLPVLAADAHDGAHPPGARIVSDVADMQLAMPGAARMAGGDKSLGRIVSVTGSKAIVLLDSPKDGHGRPAERPTWAR